MNRTVSLVSLLLLFAAVNCGSLDSNTAVALPAMEKPSADLPELPRVFVDTTMPVQSGQVRSVTACAQLQKTLNDAALGDTIVIDAGLTCLGEFNLTEKSSGSGWIIIQTSALEKLPPEGTRVNPALHAQYMPKILGNITNGRPFVARARSHHYRFIGIEMGMTPGMTSQSGILSLAPLPAGATSLDDLPHHFVVDRCYIHGNPQGNMRRGVWVGADHVGIIDSYISDIHEVGNDSQAIGGWNFRGPLKIINNYLEASGENVMFGGSPKVIEGVVPSDIEIRRNHFFKPLSWRPGNPAFAGVNWQVKNHFEVKNGQRILVEGNVMENTWPSTGGQRGYMLVLTPAHELGAVPQARVQDITIRYNRFAHASSWINTRFFSPGDNGAGPASPPDVVCFQNQVPQGCLRARRWHFHDNVVEDISSAAWDGEGKMFQVIGPADDIVLENNTVFEDQWIAFFAGPGPARNPNRLPERFVFRNNIVWGGVRGVGGNGTPDGSATLAFHAPHHIFERNVIVGPAMVSYSGKNSFEGKWEKVQFRNLAAGDYRLLPSSKYRKSGTDGKDPGADMDALEKATAGVVVTVKPPTP
ncbi:MAG: hypothetical protein M1453_14835 [Acidobacteria bacterium]|nr:hypothetical protein [Acidobacteriota bacterium]MCL5289256.1 hypothetical protein [Acidobacteriota bacterium]